MPIVKSGQALIDEVNATELQPGEAAFWWLGQHGFLLKLGETVIYIDAYLTPSGGRNIPPLLDPAEVTNADIIIGTHDHSDHIDRPSWPGMATASPNAKFIVPSHVHDSAANDFSVPPNDVIGLTAWDSVTLSGVKITAVPAAHELLSTHPETDSHEFLGVVLEGNGVCVYHAGDTCIYEGMQEGLRRWHFDLAFLPINGRDAKRFRSGCIGNMTFQEAVDLAGTLKPGLVIPTHFEMFSNNTEDPELFMDYLDAKFPDLKAQIPVHGQRVLVRGN